MHQRPQSCKIVPVVDDAGVVTVQAHDPALELWHDGAFGMLAPKLAKGP